MSHTFGGNTNSSADNEPLTVETLEKALLAIRNEHTDPPIEILSPQEYFRRLGYRKPIPSDWIARLMEEHST